MKRIPPDVERLMWLVAEEGDPRAIADFEARFPHLKADLAQRMGMIKGLKGAKRQAAIPPAIPHFRPRRAATAPKTSPRVLWTAAALGLTALALASFSLTSSLVHKPAQPTVEPPKTESQATRPRDEGGSRGVGLNPKVVEQKPTDSTTLKPPVVDSTPGYLKPIKLKMDDVPLLLLLNAIEAKSGMKLTIGPGVENPVVDADYDGQNAIEILKDLGEKYNFKPFDQGNGDVNIVPGAKKPESAPGDGGDHLRIGP